MINPDFPGFNGFHILGFLVWAFFMLIVVLAVIAVVALLVRYLLVATRAHKLYIANNTPQAPVVAEEPAVVTPKRTPKTPPAV